MIKVFYYNKKDGDTDHDDYENAIEWKVKENGNLVILKATSLKLAEYANMDWSRVVEVKSENLL